ncbi:MAG: hypothetical protein U1E14_17810 [Geminicoccaceae bacterium]
MRQLLPLLLVLLGSPASAGILLEATFQGVPVTVELGLVADKAVVTVAGERRVMALAPSLPAGPPGFRLASWSSGPMVAGYGTGYAVLSRDGTICGEVLAAAWMAPFLEPAARALAQLQAETPSLAPRDGGCGPIPFATWAMRGFPLMAGERRAPVLVTTRLRFDQPPPAELLPPPVSAASPAPSVPP